MSPGRISLLACARSGGTTLFSASSKCPHVIALTLTTPHTFSAAKGASQTVKKPYPFSTPTELKNWLGALKF